MKRTMGLLLGTVLTVSSIATVMTVSAGQMDQTAPAVRQIIENQIGMDKATDIALQDAALTADQAEFSKKVNEFSDGQYIYNIQFITRGDTKFDYEVEAFTGDILQRERESWEADDNMDYQGLEAAGQAFFMTEDEANLKAFEEAFQAALKDAGLTEADITPYKFGVNYENGKIVLDLGFIIPGEAEFDYDIELGTLMIAEKERDTWDAEDDAEYKNLLPVPAPAQAAAALKSAEPAGKAETDPKQIALKDAGFAEADVQMIKCEKDFDDGVEKYDVEFFGPDGMKYEYDIRVSGGVILERNVEADD